MYKCLKITLAGNFPEGILHSYVQKEARNLKIEGSAQVISSREVIIIACGEIEKVELFLDVLHKESKKWSPENILVEPFLKQKDYRGVFRVIE